MRKINIGAGLTWDMDGWESLDNVPGDYSSPLKHYGKAWETGLPSNCYDIAFSSHMLEHIPHFRVEKTISEFNRIMKIGGTIRILVPDLKKAAIAYLNNDEEFYKKSAHYSNHIGIGGCFMSVVNSPGSQTLAVSREMDEIIGGYAHLYSYDFDMLRIILEKWGFSEVIDSNYGDSTVKEMQYCQGVIYDGEYYEATDDFVRNKEFLKGDKDWSHTGFDKLPHLSLIVEAKKVRDETYNINKEFPHNKRARFDSKLDRIKLFLIKYCVRLVDVTFAIAKYIHLDKLYKLLQFNK